MACVTLLIVCRPSGERLVGQLMKGVELLGSEFTDFGNSSSNVQTHTHTLTQTNACSTQIYIHTHCRCPHHPPASLHCPLHQHKWIIWNTIRGGLLQESSSCLHQPLTYSKSRYITMQFVLSIFVFVTFYFCVLVLAMSLSTHDKAGWC